MLRNRGVGVNAGRLLVVDDEAAIRFALTEYFRESGWLVDAAAEKEEAEARRRGADAFLHKPLPLPQLEAVVDSLVGRAA